MTGRPTIAIFVAASLCVSGVMQAQDQASVTEKTFAAGGKIMMQLDAGNYTVRSGADNRIRVTLSGTTGSAKVALTTENSQANVSVKDTPRNNFQATIDVPRPADIVIRLSAGNLIMAAIAGNLVLRSK